VAKYSQCPDRELTRKSSTADSRRGRVHLLGRRDPGQLQVRRDLRNDCGLPGRHVQIGLDRRPVERPVGREQGRVGDQPEAFLDLHRPEPVSMNAHDREAIDLERAGRQAEDAAATVEIGRDRDPRDRAPAGAEFPRLAVGLGLDGAEGPAGGEPRR